MWKGTGRNDPCPCGSGKKAKNCCWRGIINLSIPNRELRVIVGADKIDDIETEKLSADIAKKIQDEMTYPGQVKITVIRETRAVSYAK